MELLRRLRGLLGIATIALVRRAPALPERTEI
jgi:hypothetical protein